MGGKKKAAAAKNDAAAEVDVSTEKFWRQYRKNCQIMGCDVSKRISQMYNEEYVDDQKDIEKVS